MVELTESTIETVRDLADSTGMTGLRIFVDPRPAADVALVAELVEAPSEGDEIVQSGGASVFLDAAAAEALSEKRIDARITDGKVHLALVDQ